MKKLIALILVFALALPLCGCGKSEAVKNVEVLISSIGAVTLESADAIDAAQRAFDALSADEKSKVENHYVLSDSHSTLQKLIDEEARRLEEEAKRARFNCAQEAYKNIKSAWDLVDTWAGDLYDAWYGAIMEDDEMVDNVVPYFVQNTTLTEEEVLEALTALYYTNVLNKPEGLNWGSLSDELKQSYQDATLEHFEDNIPNFQGAILLVGYAYILNGDYQVAQDTVETAKEALKVMSEQYSDYEHYPSLKGFFTTTNAMLDFCANPSGSLEQYKELLNDYRKEARDYINDLNYIFE